MTTRSPQQQFNEARRIAADHGCLVIEKAGRFQVYRKTPLRLVYLGVRGTPESLHAFIRKLTNVH